MAWFCGTLVQWSVLHSARADDQGQLAGQAVDTSSRRAGEENLIAILLHEAPAQVKADWRDKCAGWLCGAAPAVMFRNGVSIMMQRVHSMHDRGFNTCTDALHYAHAESRLRAS